MKHLVVRFVWGLSRGCMTWMPMCCKGFSRSSTFLCLMKNGKCSRSPYLDRVVAKLEERRMINVANGKKGGRPKRMGSTPETPMDKGEKPNQNQKSREEERRVTTVVKDNQQ